MTAPTDEHHDPADEGPEPRPLFQHPQWMLGVVLIFALAALYAGIFGDPVWLLIGSPFIVTLAIYVWARFVNRRPPDHP